MKKVLSLFLAMIMVLSLAACGSNSGNISTSGKDSSSDKQEASSAPTGPSRTDVKIPLQSVGASLDPHANSLVVDQHITVNVYEGLYRQDPYTGELLPRLATSYEVTDDGMEYTYHLREGVKFHNGDPFTAADVVYSYERCFENTWQASQLVGIEKVEAVNDHTVKFIMNRPNSLLPLNVAHVEIVNKNVIDELGNTYPVSVALAGTGPYYLESCDLTTKTVLKANPDYYLGKAPIETIEFITMLDASTELIAFESGQFDICSVNAADWEMISGSGKYNTQASPSLHCTYAVVNVAKPDSPLYDVRVRQAIGYCMNKEDMIAIGAEGLADVANHICRPELLYGTEETGVYYTRDIEKAKSLLAEAGYADGFEVVIQPLTSANGRYIRTAEVLLENLAEIGITATIEQGAGSTLLAAWREDKTYDIGITGLTLSGSYNDFYAYMGANNNKCQNQYDMNENIDIEYIRELQEKALSATTLEDQVKYFSETEKYQLMEGAGYLPAFHVQNLYAWDKALTAIPPISYYYIYDWNWN